MILPNYWIVGIGASLLCLLVGGLYLKLFWKYKWIGRTQACTAGAVIGLVGPFALLRLEMYLQAHVKEEVTRDHVFYAYTFFMLLTLVSIMVAILKAQKPVKERLMEKDCEDKSQ